MPITTRPDAPDVLTNSSDARTTMNVEPKGQRCFEPGKPLLSLSWLCDARATQAK
jgi:hypothetical protein